MSAYEVDGFAFIGRTFDEYCRMFDLEATQLDGQRILDCPAGPASFVATAHDRGVDATGVDIRYREPPPALADRCAAAIDDADTQLRAARDLFDWTYYGSVEDRIALLERTTRRFLADYPAGRESGRYVWADLPRLPFADDRFSLVLSSHFLFLYGDRLSRSFHRETLFELVRVATDEVRLYPLVELDGTPYPHLDAVRRILEDAGLGTEIRPVPFAFLRGATEMLVIEP